MPPVRPWRLSTRCGPGPVAGFAPVSAGTNLTVEVTLSQNAPTTVLWPMLHVDTGTVGEYEFGVVEGADGPVVVNGAVATGPIWSVPYIRMADQIAVHGAGMEMDMAVVVVADSVLAEVDGWLVPVQHRPLQPPEVGLDAALGQPRQERLAGPDPAGLGPDEQVLEVNPGAAPEGRVVVEPECEAHRRAVRLGVVVIALTVLDLCGCGA